jgi:predicted lysophospholipase L1 biosynthesis ABC-type transport system permease subunit
MISTLGSVVGLAFARVGMVLAKDVLQAQLGAKLHPAAWYSFDAVLVLGVIALAAFVALLPAMAAYRTDVAENLAPIA